MRDEEAMAAVLAEHRLTSDVFSPHCACGQWRDKRDDGTGHRAHVAAALTAAGFGSVAAAKAEALREAADAMRYRAVGTPASNWRAHGWGNWLRALADQIGADQ